MHSALQVAADYLLTLDPKERVDIINEIIKLTSERKTTMDPNWEEVISLDGYTLGTVMFNRDLNKDYHEFFEAEIKLPWELQSRYLGKYPSIFAGRKAIEAALIEAGYEITCPANENEQ
jgi:hypothetical protein